MVRTLIFGPVPSRRLGKSLGINNIPYKHCSYSCLYCQVGKTIKKQVSRCEFYDPDLLADGVRKYLDALSEEDMPDYVTIVANGEPSLDLNLGFLIKKMKQNGLPVAVITNASLITSKEVREELGQADYVSVKVDTMNEKTWKTLNRPHSSLVLQHIKDSLLIFKEDYSGKLVTETMLVKNVNDSESEIYETSAFISSIFPDIAFISIPTRPTAFNKAYRPAEGNLVKAYAIFEQRGLHTEFLIGYEGNAFASSGNFTKDILSITAVHPMRREAVLELLQKSKSSERELNLLLSYGMIKEITYNNQVYYQRNFSKK
ncbi:MAG TPA: radical SAM protein [Bacteroidales bacterium]|nr:radical SAM protein [Bacteroidales bacterium]HPT01048.1 radical SAM protein [Bacteroidales bacterium]